MKIRVKILITAVFLLFFLPISAYFLPHTSYLLTHTVYAQNNLTPQQKAQLEAELAQVEADQKQAEKDLADAQGQSASITKDISVLTAKIKVAQLNIKAKNLLIESLGKDIQKKVDHIETLDERIQRGKDTLAQILRKTNEVGSYSLPEVILSQSSVTGFFKDLDNFNSVQEGLKTTFEQVRSDKIETESEKDALDKRKNAETDARYAIQQEEKSIKANEAEKQGLLKISKSNEKAYTNLLAERRARAAKIRATLFPLAGGQKISFPDALKYAQEASAKTGVRPAFLIAILTNESALGANVGNCYLTNQQTGDGVFTTTGLPSPFVMKPTRDVQPFLEITNALGLDPSRTVVSCQQVSAGGWGGAMGPAQFIPSTWKLMKDSIASLLGISGMPNPWDSRQAFMASALYLSNLGAGNGGYTAERNAACKYYSGSVCSKSRVIAGYGDNAIRKAIEIQQDIDEQQGV
ncbi:MAG: lytic murein transglycosylase [Patescibacteria group bacterium]